MCRDLASLTSLACTDRARVLATDTRVCTRPGSPEGGPHMQLTNRVAAEILQNESLYAERTEDHIEKRGEKKWKLQGSLP